MRDRHVWRRRPIDHHVENVSPEQYAAFMVAGLKSLSAELSA
ncbi:MAG: hypothetical protein AAGA42_03715 [Actinomycetota bacterium]